MLLQSFLPKIKVIHQEKKKKKKKKSVENDGDVSMMTMEGEQVLLRLL
ncbi:hypothetical protein KSS87_016938 [Heliosperma pusillum]|nr:hypothetical protein KSS87_016938 [Heliosperma pusillum]